MGARLEGEAASPAVGRRGGGEWGEEGLDEGRRGGGGRPLSSWGRRSCARVFFAPVLREALEARTWFGKQVLYEFEMSSTYWERFGTHRLEPVSSEGGGKRQRLQKEGCSSQRTFCKMREFLSIGRLSLNYFFIPESIGNACNESGIRTLRQKERLFTGTSPPSRCEICRINKDFICHSSFHRIDHI